MTDFAMAHPWLSVLFLAPLMLMLAAAVLKSLIVLASRLLRTVNVLRPHLGRPRTCALPNEPTTSMVKVFRQDRSDTSSPNAGFPVEPKRKWSKA